MSTWIGLLLAIPLGVITNLLTPRFSASLQRRSDKKVQKERALQAKQFKKARRFAVNPIAYQSFFYRSLLRVIAGVAYSFISAGLVVFFINLKPVLVSVFMAVPLGAFSIFSFSFAFNKGLEAYTITELVDEILESSNEREGGGVESPEMAEEFDLHGNGDTGVTSNG